MNGITSDNLVGFMVLPITPNMSYRGVGSVDRVPFEPTLSDDELNHPDAQVDPDVVGIWQFHPPGWRRDAYKLQEENRVDTEYDMYLIASLEVAQDLVNMIQPYVGPHEVLRATIYEYLSVREVPARGELLGYDVAYPGGDYYSAILNGVLFPSATASWAAHFRQFINAHGLFTTIDPIGDYLQYFRANVPSEARADFVIYQLEVPAAS